MANRYLTQFFYSLWKKPVLVSGKISLSAAAAVSSFDIPGVATVAKTGTGEYTVTLQDKYCKLISLQLSASDSTQDLLVDSKSIDVVSAKTFKIITKVAGSAANITAACTVYVNLLASNSSVD
jgi:hypothetical protein